MIKEIWRSRAKKKSKEVKELKKRIKELENSRDRWKEQADLLKEELKKNL